MKKRITAGMRVMLKKGPARGIRGIVTDDSKGRTVRWDPATITVPAGFESRHDESELAELLEVP